MPNQKISMTRFKWKIAPWLRLENIEALWIYCHKGILSFEYAINPEVNILPTSVSRALYSTNLHHPNFIKVSDPKIIASIGKKMKTLDVKGALGKGILLGEMNIEYNSINKTIPIMTTLLDWRDFYLSTKNLSV